MKGKIPKARRGSVIYRKWTVNGVPCEIAKPFEFVEHVAIAIDTLGLLPDASGRFLALTLPMFLPGEAERDASLEILNADELRDRISSGRLGVIRALKGNAGG